MNIAIERILEFHDLYPNEDALDIKSVLKRYNRPTLVKYAYTIGHIYGKSYIPDKNATFFSQCSEKYIKELNVRITRFLSENSLTKCCYCSVKTALHLLKYIFSIKSEEYIANANLDDIEYDLFRVILQINEELSSYSKGTHQVDLATLIFLQLYSISDIPNQNERDTFIYQTQYYSKLSEFIESNSRCVAIRESFYNQTGIECMCEYSKTWACLVSACFNKQYTIDLSRDCDPDKVITKSVLDFMSIDINEYVPFDNEEDERRIDNVDYRIFRSKPLIKTSYNTYIIYNSQLLFERLYSSLFFDIKGAIKKDAFNFYNKQFVEHILFQQQMLKCINSRTCSRIYPTKEMIENPEDNEDPNQPDFYIREGYNLILFECKAIRLNGALKDKNDISEILKVLHNKLCISANNIDKKRGQKKSERVGITQLIHQMNLIEDDTFIWDNQIPDDVAYYPVIVLEDPRLVVPGISYIINDWYQNIVATELPEQICNPVVVMSINTLYYYRSIFKRNGFHRVFDEYYRSCKNNTTDNHASKLLPKADFNEFMHERYKLSKNEKLQFFEESKRALLG
jgi:hypothetical protein